MATVAQDRDAIRQRMATVAKIAGDVEWEDCLYSALEGIAPDGREIRRRYPRWRTSARWIEFECGCVAERCRELHTQMVPGDAVIFVGLEHQAVYEHVCDKHLAGMNDRCGLVEHGMTWAQWYDRRRHVLMKR
jgi:hypothetical protein